jgi:hypothetical protein
MFGVQGTYVADEAMLPAAVPGQPIGQLHPPGEIAVLVELKLLLEIDLPRDAGIDQMIEMPGFQPLGRRGKPVTFRSMRDASCNSSRKGNMNFPPVHGGTKGGLLPSNAGGIRRQSVVLSGVTCMSIVPVVHDFFSRGKFDLFRAINANVTNV